MNKTEYVSMIEKALVGKISPQELRDTVVYYRDYIDMEIRKGKSEQEVLDRLGDPRLLAKSIIAANESKSEGIDDYSKERVSDDETERVKVHRIPFPVILLIVVLMFFMIFGALMSIVRILMPVVLPVVLIVIIVSWIKRRGN